VTPRLVGLVADDLTGATDSAVQFAAVGWSAHLLRSPGAGPGIVDSGPSLLAMVTGVRAAAHDLAAERTAAAVRALLARGCERLYIKIDSTMRGSVAGQLHGALAAWAEKAGDAGVVLCPAFPDQGRTVVGGQVLVDGVPVACTAAATDPVTPVVDSRLDRLVPGSTATTLPDLDLLPEPSHGNRKETRVVFVDAATDADLAAIASSIDRLGPPWVAAGSAGLAAAMARQWSSGRGRTPAADRPSARVLVGVSSLHPVALNSVERLRDTMAARGARERPAVDVITTPATRADAAMIAARFGDSVAAQLATAPYDALVLVGGDGAAATLDRVGATAITVHSALAPGVPIGTIVGGAAHGVRVVTKSGGFGDADSLVRIIDRLQSSAHHRKEHP
jgi:D-threonate/D-erythronate kinase